jgi:RNA polymerase sigma-70 factor (ECF subfamily)
MSDEERLITLMVQYQSGQADAFEEFYRLVKPGLCQYLIIKSMDRQWAEELLQETFLQIHRSRHTYLPGKPVNPWIFSIAHYVYLSARRARIRRSIREESIENHLSDFPVPPDIETSVDAGNIRVALAGLAPEHREAVLLHHYWGFSFQEIGAILGIRAGTAKLRAYRGLLKLREQLNMTNVTPKREEDNNPADTHNP